MHFDIRHSFDKMAWKWSRRVYELRRLSVLASYHFTEFFIIDFAILQVARIKIKPHYTTFSLFQLRVNHRTKSGFGVRSN